MEYYNTLSKKVQSYLLSGIIPKQDIEDYLQYAPRMGIACYNLDPTLETARLDSVLVHHGEVISIQAYWFGADRDEICNISEGDEKYRDYSRLRSFSLADVASFIRRVDKNAEHIHVFYDVMTTSNLLRSSERCADLISAAEPLGLVREAEALISSSIQKRILADIKRITSFGIPLSEEGESFSGALRRMKWELSDREDEFDVWQDHRYVEPHHIYCEFSLMVSGNVEDNSRLYYSGCLESTKQMVTAL